MTAESTVPTTLTFPPDALPELHALILSNLPYKDLLCFKRVAKSWKAIVESDLALQAQTFKKATSVYRDNGVNDKSVQRNSEPVTVGFLLFCEIPLSVGTQIHPALQSMNWMFGQPASKAELYTDSDEELSLSAAGVLDDLATIPAVHTFKISLDDEGGGVASPIVVKNSKGITVLDVLTRLVEAAEEPVGVGRKGKPILMYERMGDHRFFEGFSYLKRKGTKLFASIFTGS
ncbi:hypothetical protein FB45DRAFT_1089464 [Roridomyces roridus]|uniref:F-box domain-containing protein n=1 Tax=Roridomyces roridus TaxID=1738132 RepID=A0AAD7BL04_9AGAR|nr:hypothetical protein FB45DRAFT_1089464 [Roridomyces roridus]